MRQLSLLPAGAQPWCHGSFVTACTVRRFAYCSSLAIYVYYVHPYDRDVAALQHILGNHAHNLTGVSWCSIDRHLLASSSGEDGLFLWNVATNDLLFHIETPAKAWGVCFQPGKRNVLACLVGHGTPYLWNTESQTLDSIGSVEKARVLRWCPGAPSLLAGGTRDGFIWLYNVNTREHKRSAKHASGTKEAIVDLQWDPLSPNFLLFCDAKGTIALFDVETFALVHTFDRIGTAGVAAIAWIPWVPGGFVSVEDRSGTLRVWNVSQKVSMETLRVSESGFHAFCFIPESHLALATFKSGSVGMYDIERRRMVFQTAGGHVETIFDCMFETGCSDHLATASYDGSIKVWDIRDMKCITTLPSQGVPIYCVSWAPPGDERLLVACSSNGDCLIWNVDSAALVRKLQLHSNLSLRCAWNQKDRNLLAATCMDGTCTIFASTGEILRRYALPDAATGCDWSPFNSNLLATGCADGIVRVFDVSQSGGQPVRSLKGHTKKAFNTQWSPLLRDILASGSDDKTIRVWRLRDQTCTVLTGHTKFVRALVFCPEVAHLLLSGSWDGSIRMWDIRSGACLGVFENHHGDVYGLSCHPFRPFLLASSSRDTTLRLWTLEEHVAECKILAVCGYPWTEVRGTDKQGSESETSVERRRISLVGEVSKDIGVQMNALQTALEKLKVAFDFFTTPNGTWELFDLASRIATGKPSHSKNRVMNVQDITAFYRARAMKLETTPSGSSATQQNHLEEAATLHLLLGNVPRYCELNIDLGHWLQALSVAPAHSMDYWAELAQRFATHNVTPVAASRSVLGEGLFLSPDTRTITYLLAANRIEELVQFYLDAGMLDEAMLVVAVQGEGGYDRLKDRDLSIPPNPREERSPRRLAAKPPPVDLPSLPAPTTAPTALRTGALPSLTHTAATKARECSESPAARSTHRKGLLPPLVSATSAPPHPVPESSSPRQVTMPGKLASNEPPRHETRKASNLQHYVSSMMSDRYLSGGDPVLAACCHLAVGELELAVQKLMRGNEVELAAALARSLRISSADHVYQALALRCERLGMWELAWEVLQWTCEPLHHIEMLCVRCLGAQASRGNELWKKANLRSHSSYAESAKRSAAIGDIQGTVRGYILSLDHQRAADVALNAVWDMLSKPNWNHADALALVRPLRSVDVTQLDEIARLRLYVCWSYLGFLEAIWRGYGAVFNGLLRTTVELCERHSLSFPIPIPTMLLEGAKFTAYFSYTFATKQISDLFSRNDIPEETLEAARVFRSHLEDPEGPYKSRPTMRKNVIVLKASKFPSGTRGRQAPVSLFSRKKIQGPEFLLEDGRTTIGTEEMVMWSKCCVLSPLCTGERIIPY